MTAQKYVVIVVFTNQNVSRSYTDYFSNINNLK